MVSLPRDAEGRIIFDQLGDHECRDATHNFEPELMEGEGESAEFSCQTVDISQQTQSTQARYFKSKEVQTSQYGGHDEDTVRNAGGGDYNVSPGVLAMSMEALDRNAKSRAFDGYAAEWEAMSTSVQVMYTLALPQDKDKAKEKGGGGGGVENMGHGTPASTVAWNCTGNLLAVGYGRMSIQGTDTEGSCVCVWNLQRAFVKSDRPDETFETSSSVMSAAFHTKHPAILAAGTFSGEFLLWNVGKGGDGGEKQIAVTRGARIHREAITQIEWVYWDKYNDYQAITSSTDGHVVIWKCKEDFDACWPLASYNVVPNDYAKTGLAFAHRSQYEKKKNLGITCMAVEKVISDGALGAKETGVFLTGTETGGVFKCFHNQSQLYEKVRAEGGEEALRSHKHAATAEEPPNLGNPITYSYQPHAGPVHAVACSPLQRNLFASCGADGTIRLQSSLLAAPVASYEPSSSYLYSVGWSSVRPLVFAAGGGLGQVFVYDVHSSEHTPVETLEMPGGTNVYSVAFNKRGGDLLAAGEGSGAVRVWRLGKGLVEPLPGESEHASSLAGAGE